MFLADPGDLAHAFANGRAAAFSQNDEGPKDL